MKRHLMKKAEESPASASVVIYVRTTKANYSD
jgi:hypothetical protein